MKLRRGFSRKGLWGKSANDQKHLCLRALSYDLSGFREGAPQVEWFFEQESNLLHISDKNVSYQESK